MKSVIYWNLHLNHHHYCMMDLEIQEYQLPGDLQLFHCYSSNYWEPEIIEHVTKVQKIQSSFLANYIYFRRFIWLKKLTWNKFRFSSGLANSGIWTFFRFNLWDSSLEGLSDDKKILPPVVVNIIEVFNKYLEWGEK